MYTFVLILESHQDYRFISLEEHYHNWYGDGYVNSRQVEITVADEAASAKYQEAYYWHSQLLWEPNLSPEGRDENLREANGLPRYKCSCCLPLCEHVLHQDSTASRKKPC